VPVFASHPGGKEFTRLAGAELDAAGEADPVARDARWARPQAPSKPSDSAKTKADAEAMPVVIGLVGRRAMLS